MKYTLSKNYKNSGPFELYEMVRMAKSGELQDGSGWFACMEGQKKWVEITTIPEIRSAFAPQAKPKNVQPTVSQPFKSKKK